MEQTGLLRRVNCREEAGVDSPIGSPLSKSPIVFGLVFLGYPASSQLKGFRLIRAPAVGGQVEENCNLDDSAVGVDRSFTFGSS